MISHPIRAPRTNHGNRTRLALGALLLALGATQVGCVVHSHPVYVVEQAPPPPPVTTVVVEEGADDTVVVDDFYEPLSYYGVWVWVPGYGRVWQPASDMAGASFVPYTSHGRWVLNGDGDWVFVSTYDAQWGWATYHYGRWAWTDYYGWVWIPGRAWAPAWVDWRYGGGYVGWVPMGPPGYVVVEEHWIFVERTYVGAASVESYRLPPERARAAYVAASPMIEIKGDSKWKAGPPPADLKASGVDIASAQVVKPPAGYIKSQGKVTVEAAGERKLSGRIPTEPYVRPGTKVAVGAGVAPPPPPGGRGISNNVQPGVNQPGVNQPGVNQPGITPQPGMGQQPGMNPGMNPGMGPQPGVTPQPGITPQPGVTPMPQPQPSPGLQPRPQPAPMPQPAPQPTVQPRPQPAPMPQPAPHPRPTATPPPAPRPTVAPAPKPAPKPTVTPKPAPPKKRK